MNEIYLGTLPDSVIEFADKRINGKILAETTSACYSVCEVKGATMPSEKTPQNLSACINSIAGGYSGGDLDVPVTGNITGVDASGYSVTGGICGNVYGDVCGNVCGVVVGNVENINGEEYAVCGDIDGSVGGSICGDVGGAVGGNAYGGVYGTVFLPNVSGSNVTIDTSSENAALHINVSDTDYYIHVS